MKPHAEKLSALHACRDGLAFAETYDTWQACWDAIPRGDWSLWLLGKLAGPPDSESRRKLVGVCSLITREVLPIFERRFPNDKRVRTCLDVLDRYAVGKATMAEVLKARSAACAAACAASCAACAASCAVCAASCAACAATYADGAASCAAYAACARKMIRQKSADIVRQHYPTAPELP